MYYIVQLKNNDFLIIVNLKYCYNTQYIFYSIYSGLYLHKNCLFKNGKMELLLTLIFAYIFIFSECQTSGSTLTDHRFCNKYDISSNIEKDGSVFPTQVQEIHSKGFRMQHVCNQCLYDTVDSERMEKCKITMRNRMGNIPFIWNLKRFSCSYYYFSCFDWLKITSTFTVCGLRW